MCSFCNFVSHESACPISQEQSPILPPERRSSTGVVACPDMDGVIELLKHLSVEDASQKRFLQKIRKLSQKHEEASRQLQSPKEVWAAFLKGDEKAIVGFVKHGSEGRVFQRPVYGPVQKSEYTIEAENLFDDLFAHFTEAVATDTEKGVVIRIKTREYNLFHILPFAQYDLISLTKGALETYRKLLLSDQILYKPRVKVQSDAAIEHYFYKRGYTDPEDPELRLSVAEKLAINIFTDDGYKIINPLLRNQIDKAIAQNTQLPPSLSSEERLGMTVKEALVHIAVVITGLQKLPDYRSPDGRTKYVWRIEYEDLEFPLHIRRRAIKEGEGVGYQFGFFSCSHTKPEPFKDSTIAAGVVIKKSKGKDVSSLSAHPEEREILFLPSFIQWKHVREVKGIPLFYGEMVSPPQDYPALYDFGQMRDYFLSINPCIAHEELLSLPVEIQARFCAFIIQTGEKALGWFLEDFFKSTDVGRAFSSVGSQIQKILLSYAQEQKKPIPAQLLRLHAQSLALEKRASQMIQDGELSNSSFATISALREYLGHIAATDADRLRQYYSREDLHAMILALKQECEKRFTRETLLYCGQDSLNRELLVSTGWNRALCDPEVILALFAMEVDPKAAGLCNQLNSLSYAKGRTISSMIAEGVRIHHPVALETLPLNRPGCPNDELSHIQAYIKRKTIHQTFVPILYAIAQAYMKAVAAPPPPFSQKSLFDIPYTPSGWRGYLNLFDVLVRAICSADETALLSSEAKTSVDELKGELQKGFSIFCTAEKIDIRNTTLQELIERMASSDELLHQDISHLMYDCLHFLVALRCQEVTIELKDETISLGELFRKVLEFFTRQSELSVQYAIAAEQFWSRLLFLAERLSSSSLWGLSHDSLMQLVEEPSCCANHRAADIQQMKTQELKAELQALSAHDEIRSLLADDFSFPLLSPHEIEKLEFTALMAYKRAVMAIFKEGYLSTRGYTLHDFGKPSLDELVHNPCLTLQFLKWIRFIHFHLFGNLIHVVNGALPTTFEEYERKTRKVMEFLSNPDNASSICEINCTDQFITNTCACTLLRMLPSLEKIHIEFTISDRFGSVLQRTFQTLAKHGLDDKINAISFNSSAFSNLPKEVWNLRNLRELSFLDCHSLLMDLDNTTVPKTIQKLTIKDKDLKRFPRFIFGLTGLVELHLNCFKLKSIPNEISNLKKLQKLSLTSSYIMDFPKSILDLTGLLELHFNCFELKCIPNEISNLVNLQKLSLMSSYINCIPKSIDQLQNLIELNLNSLSLTSIPDEITSLPNLQKFGIIGRSVKYIPTSFWGMRSLREVNFSTAMDLSIPVQTPSLPNLHRLSIMCQQGQTIKGLERLKSVRELSIANFDLRETVDEFASLEHLETLSLSSDSLNSIPESILSLKGLIGLSISGQNLRVIPDEIASLTHLQTLLVESRSLEEIPESLGSMKSLIDLTVKCKALKGIPEGLWQVQTLQSLVIKTENPLSLGKITQLSNLKKVTLHCPLTEHIETARFEDADIPHNPPLA